MPANLQDAQPSAAETASTSDKHIDDGDPEAQKTSNQSLQELHHAMAALKLDAEESLASSAFLNTTDHKRLCTKRLTTELVRFTEALKVLTPEQRQQGTGWPDLDTGVMDDFVRAFGPTLPDGEDMEMKT